MNGNQRIYCRAILPRSGLANRLFPWARCVVFSHLHRVPMIAPYWWQLKLGPLLRGESDSRLYFGLFKPGKSEISGLRRLWLKFVAARLSEPEDLRQPVLAANGVRSVVEFSGVGDYFKCLAGWHIHLLDSLQSITRNRWIQTMAHVPQLDTPVGIHVRRGDFVQPNNPGDLLTKGNMRTPLDWFVKCLRIIRQCLGFDVGAYVVSDGTDDQLAELLEMPKVVLLRTGSAIADLLALSKAGVLLGSGGSSFSAWASFFGQMPTVVVPGQNLTWFNLAANHGNYLGEFDPDSPPEVFLNQLKTVCASASN